MPATDGFYELTATGKLRYHLHPGQLQAWDSERLFVAVIAGTQSGKTSFGPAWLHREIKTRGPGDYLIATPTFALLDKKALPEFQKLFVDYLGLGRYVGSPTRRFVVNHVGQKRLWNDYGRDYKTTVWFGYAADPESLESATVKAIWIDECGQRTFRRESYGAVFRRRNLYGGRILATSTPYYWGWFKSDFWDKRHTDLDIDVVNFESIMNPAFSREEWERAKRTEPPWRFDMFYRGRFTRPAGLIYNSFDQDTMTCRPFAVPPEWPRYVGLDFGGVNTAAVFVAADTQSDALYLYREYHRGDATAAGHAAALLEGETGELQAFGGAAGEQQWRDEFTAAGLRVYRPLVSDVEVGINRVYALFATGRLRVFDTCSAVLDELANYSRVTDEDGNPLEAIADKSRYHRLDALRYVGTYLNQGLAQPLSGWVEPHDPIAELSF